MRLDKVFYGAIIVASPVGRIKRRLMTLIILWAVAFAFAYRVIALG